MTDQKFGSFDDKDFTEGGYFDDRDGVISGAKVVTFDFMGKADPACCLHIEITPDDAEGDDDKRNEYYRIGGLDRFTPSADGEQYVPVGTVSSMNKNSKAAAFLRALKDKGFQLSRLAQGVSQLVGLHCHFNVIQLPPVKDRETGQEKEQKALVVTKIHGEGAAIPGTGAKSAAPKPAAKKPGGGAAKAPAAAPAATTTTAAPASAGAVDEEVSAALEGVILELIGASANGAVAKTLVPNAVFKGIADAKVKAAAMKLFANAAWLGAEDRSFVLDGGELKMRG